MPSNEQIYTLHRYFIWSNRMLLAYEDTLEVQGPPPEDPRERWHWLVAPFAYASYWFASLYVLVEGYQQLKLTDSQIAPLLESANVDLLRRYRNAVFHFQPEYYDARLQEFIDKGDEIVEWVRALHEAFSGFFLHRGGSRGIEHRLYRIAEGQYDLVIRRGDEEQRLRIIQEPTG